MLAEEGIRSVPLSKSRTMEFGMEATKVDLPSPQRPIAKIRSWSAVRGLNPV